MATAANTLRIITHGGAGNTVDILGRITADYLSKSTDRNVIVENRPGAQGLIALHAVANAHPDGHTILISEHKYISDNQDLNLYPVSPLAIIPILLTTSPRFQTPEEWWQEGRKRLLTYGSLGSTTITDKLIDDLIGPMGIQVQKIPFRTMS